MEIATTTSPSHRSPPKFPILMLTANWTMKTTVNWTATVTTAN